MIQRQKTKGRLTTGPVESFKEKARGKWKMLKWKWKYGNRNTEVRRKATYQHLVHEYAL